MRVLNWDEFNSCIAIISNSCKGKDFSGVYGIPRGGLCLAVALSHSLNIPLLSEIKDGCLVVDDVYETGRTLNQVIDIPHITTFVWFSKVTPKGWKAVEIAKTGEWLVFPWESRDRVYEDMTSYQFSRT